MPLLTAAAAALAPGALLAPAARAAGDAQRQTGPAPYDVRAALPQNDPAASGAPASALARQLGPQAVVALDPATGTPRRVLRTDGALTGRSGAAPARIALDYVRAHQRLFGLGADELAALPAPRATTTPAGIRVLRWTQRYRGLPVLGAGLSAAVAADGRLLTVGGAPLADASVPTTTPAVAAPAAIARARRNAGAADGGSARLVIFAADDGARLAWSVRVDADSTHRYRYVVDATDGAVLKRDNLVRFADSGGATSVWSYAPSDDAAPNPRYVVPADLDRAPWRPQRRTFGEGWITSIDGSRLEGENAHVYSDVDDDDRADTLEEVAANSVDPDTGAPVWDYPLTPISPVGNEEWPSCLPTFPCTWRSFWPQTPDVIWRRNREQNATQVFWFLNSFKEWLAAPPIGFGARDDEDFSGDDPVIGQTDDGADQSIRVTYDRGRTFETIDHHPDGSHLSNANMYTPPNGQSPTMQMYLFSGGGDFPDANGGDDASIVFHEYTHGLSSRLVTDSDGYQALNAPQSGAMGEAWSDWYAMDYLTATGQQKDDPAVDGEVLLSSYISAGSAGDLREQALDCPVDAPTDPDACGDGGFTYADYGKVLGTYGPEVHADGEIWAQTLWDLRGAVGADYARELITEAMRLPGEEPSFLDMRDRILLADENAGRTRHDDIWQVFAARGMGYYATTEGPYDPAPVADDSLPPADEEGATTTVSGTVTDADTGRPVAGVVVSLPGPTDRRATTGADGSYTIVNALAGVRYPRITTLREGYDDATGPAVDLTTGARSGVDLQVRRNWALYSGGTTVDFDRLAGPDLTALGCGPERAIDGSHTYGWGSYQPNYDGSAHAGYGMPVVGRGPRSVVLRLPAAVDLSGIAIDPGAICGDDDSASLGGFRLETSTDGSSWRTAASGTFTRAFNHRRNAVPFSDAGAKAGVRFVRLTMLSPQGDGSSAAYFMDMAELALYGAPAGTVVDPPGPPDPPGPGPDPQPPVQNPQPPVQQPGPPVANPTPRRPARQTTDPNAEALRLTSAQIVLPRKRSLAAVLSRKGVALKVRASRRVKVTATVTLPAATARKLKLTRQRKGTVAIARLSDATVAANRATVLHVRLPRNTAAWIEHARVRKLTFGVALLATDAKTGRIATRLLRATAKR